MGGLQDFSDTLRGWGEHWQSQWERHEQLYRVGGAYVLLGPAAAGAYQRVVEQNQLAAQQEASSGALAQMAQQPLGGLGATGELQISPAISQWIPIGLAFLVVMYLIFKD